MSIHTIESVVDIGEDRRLVLQLPDGISPGRYRVVTVLDELPDNAPIERTVDEPWWFPILVNAQWPSDMPLSRAEM